MEKKRIEISIPLCAGLSFDKAHSFLEAVEESGQFTLAAAYPLGELPLSIVYRVLEVPRRISKDWSLRLRVCYQHGFCIKIRTSGMHDDRMGSETSVDSLEFRWDRPAMLDPKWPAEVDPTPRMQWKVGDDILWFLNDAKARDLDQPPGESYMEKLRSLPERYNAQLHRMIRAELLPIEE